jgi:DNA polymerase III delta subunit
VFSADASFDWGTLLQAGASMSLFAEKRLLELRLPSASPVTRAPPPSSSTARARPKTRCC